MFYYLLEMFVLRFTQLILLANEMTWDEMTFVRVLRVVRCLLVWRRFVFCVRFRCVSLPLLSGIKIWKLWRSKVEPVPRNVTVLNFSWATIWLSSPSVRPLVSHLVFRTNHSYVLAGFSPKIWKNYSDVNVGNIFSKKIPLFEILGQMWFRVPDFSWSYGFFDFLQNFTESSGKK